MARTKAKGAAIRDTVTQTGSSSNSSNSPDTPGSDLLENHTVASFSLNEEVLVYQGQILTNATVIENHVKNDTDAQDAADYTYYKVHYHGSSQEDEIVSANRMLKMTEETVFLQKTLTEELNNRPSIVAARALAVSLNETAIAANEKTIAQNYLDEMENPGIEANPDSAAIVSISTEKAIKKENATSKSIHAPSTSGPVTRLRKRKQDDIISSSSTSPESSGIMTPNGIATPTKKQTEASKATTTILNTRGRKRKQETDDTTVASSSSSPATPQGTNHKNLDNTRQIKKSKKTNINISVTDEMKIRLIDDWEWVTNYDQLVPLPKAKSVNIILGEFREYKFGEITKTVKNSVHRRNRGRRVRNPQEEAFLEILNGLKEYFNEVLGVQLLYKAERQQLFDLRERNGNFEYSSVYGAEHLMRLLMILPQQIANVNMRDEKAEKLREVCQELVWFLECHADTYFATIYNNATPRYVRLSEAF